MSIKPKYDALIRKVREDDGDPSGDLKNIDSIDFNPLKTQPAHNEGVLFYSDAKNALSYYNDVSDVTVNLGQEVLFPVENQSGSTILNGSVVYPDTTTVIGLADSSNKDKSRIIAVATHDILDGDFGYVTKLGQVGGLNTSSYTAGQIIYLSDSTPGSFTATKPVDGSYIVTVGVIDIVDPTEGIITVDTRSSDHTVEVNDINGFPGDQRDNITLSFENSTRTFTISSSSYPYHYYVLGEKFEKESSDSIVITDTEGLHVFYYDDDTLNTLVNPNDAQLDSVIRTKSIVSYIYWNATDSMYNYFANELHGISMSPVTHAYLHFTRGAQYLSGLGLNSISTGQSGDIDSHAQFGVDAGYYADEDIIITSDSTSSTSGLSIYYLDGANGYLRRTTETGTTDGYSVLTDITAGVDTTGRLVYNQWTGTDWTLTLVSNNDFVLCHVFAINGIDGEDKLIAFIGQDDYLTRSAARDGAENEINSLLTILPVQEIIPVGTIIYQTSNGYDNEVRARIISTDDGSDYVDWRTSELKGGTSPTSHNNLSNLELSDTGVTWGHIDDQDQTIYGGKTFNSNIVAPNIVSGRYTPTLTAVTNINASGAYAGHYMRIDNEITVSMRVNVDATASSTTTELGISLPVASSLTSLQDAVGVSSQSDTNSNGIISADITNNRVTLKFESLDTVNRDWWLTFIYQIK